MILAGTGLVHFRDKYLLLTLSIRSRHCLEPCHIVLRWWIVATIHFIALIFPTFTTAPVSLSILDGDLHGLGTGRRELWSEPWAS